MGRNSRLLERQGVQKLLTARLTDEELKIASADHAFMEVLPTQYTSRSQAEYDLPLGKGLLGIKKILEEKYANLIEERKPLLVVQSILKSMTS